MAVIGASADPNSGKNPRKDLQIAIAGDLHGQWDGLDEELLGLLRPDALPQQGQEAAEPRHRQRQGIDIGNPRQSCQHQNPDIAKQLAENLCAGLSLCV